MIKATSIKTSGMLVHNPFGMITVGRSWEVGNQYRYGFNGKESDSETYDDGNIYDYGFRIYNPRLGKFLSVDPLSRSFPWYTPFQFSGNNPIKFVDLDGLETHDPSEDPFLVARLLYTTFYDLKHSIENVAFTAAGVVTGQPSKVVAGYAKNEDGEEIFETEIKEDIPWQPVGYEMLDFGLNALNICGTFVGVYSKVPTPTGFLFAKTTTTNQTVRSIDLLVGAFAKAKWVEESTNGWSEAAKAYQKHVTGVEAGFAFQVNGYEVKFDGFRGNTLIEAKSSYANFIENGEFVSWFTKKPDLISQAKKQIEAAMGAPIEWHFSTQEMLDATKKLFDENNIKGITYVYNPIK